MIANQIKVDPVSKESRCIAYITEMFPSLTQTFVYRELLAVRDHESRAARCPRRPQTGSSEDSLCDEKYGSYP